MRKTFPKEGIKKQKQVIRELKAEINKLEKEIRFLNQELLNIMKSERKRVQKKSEPGFDEWRKNFLERFRKEVLNKNEFD